jgi:ABC-type amino acid transport substrate-binding protein
MKNQFSSRIFSLLTLCFIFLNGSSISAKELSLVPLFLQERLDVNGKQLPDSDTRIKLIGFLERESGLKFHVINLPWKRAQMMTLEGKGIIWGLSKTPERLSNYRFSETVMLSKIWGIAFGNPRIELRNILDLQGKTVSVVHGVSYGMDFEIVKNKLFKVETDIACAASRFKKLVLKRSDVLLWDEVQFDQQKQLMEYLHITYIPNMKDQSLLNMEFYTSPTPLFVDSTHFGSAKGSFLPEMEKIDRAIRKGTRDGDLVKIFNNHG